MINPRRFALSNWTPAELGADLHGWYDASDSDTVLSVRGQLGILDPINLPINPNTGKLWKVGDKYRLVFIWSGKTFADSSDIADYNQDIQDAADAAGLGLDETSTVINWYAMVSTSTVDCRDNTHTRIGVDDDSAIIMMDGIQCPFLSLSQMWEGKYRSNDDISLDENGDERPKEPYIWASWGAVWTGTNQDGTAYSNRVMGDVSGLTRLGLMSAEKNFWISRSDDDNDATSPDGNNLPMYGISQILTVQASTDGATEAVYNKKQDGVPSVLETNSDRVSQSTASAKPTTGSRTQNGLNVLDCDGGDFLSQSSFPVDDSGDHAIIGVALIDVINNASDSLWSIDSTQDYQLDAANASQFNGEIDATGGTNVSLTGGPYTGAHLFATIFDYTGAGEISARVDGSVNGTPQTYSTKLSTSQTLRLFADRSGANIPDGAMAEFVVLKDLSLKTILKVEGYLAHKWGVTDLLPSDHPFKYQAPTRTARAWTPENLNLAAWWDTSDEDTITSAAPPSYDVEGTESPISQGFEAPDQIYIDETEGQKDSEIWPGDSIVVAGSSSNNGTYEVESVLWDGTRTIITTVETSISNESVDGATVTPTGFEHVSQIDDKSGNGNHATQSTEYNKPRTGGSADDLNGLNVLRFLGATWGTNAGDWLEFTTIDLRGREAWVIAKPDAGEFAAGEDFTCLGDTGNRQATFVPSTGDLADLRYWDNNGVWEPANEVVDDAIAGGTPYVVGFLGHIRTGEQEKAFSVDGVHYDNKGYFQGLDDGNGNRSRIGRSQYTYDTTGIMGEIVIVDGELSEDDRQRMEGYLAHKWGLAWKLPLDHPYKGSPPLVEQDNKPLWNPIVFAPAAWYDAADNSTIHEDTTPGRVSQWDDKSGNGNDLTAASTSYEPSTGTRTQNNLNALDFDPSANQCLEKSSPSGVPITWDIFLVYQRDRTSEADYLLTFNGSGTSSQIRGNRFSDVSLDGSFDGGAGFNTGGSSSDINPHIWNARIDGTTGVYLFLDGTQADQDISDPGTVTIDTYIRFGANAFRSDGHDGFIAEILVFPYLSAEERELVEGYLAWKWGLVDNLPEAHPYKHICPTL